MKYAMRVSTIRTLTNQPEWTSKEEQIDGIDCYTLTCNVFDIRFKLYRHIVNNIKWTITVNDHVLIVGIKGVVQAIQLARYYFTFLPIEKPKFTVDSSDREKPPIAYKEGEFEVKLTKSQKEQKEWREQVSKEEREFDAKLVAHVSETVEPAKIRKMDWKFKPLIEPEFDGEFCVNGEPFNWGDQAEEIVEPETKISNWSSVEPKERE